MVMAAGSSIHVPIWRKLVHCAPDRTLTCRGSSRGRTSVAAMDLCWRCFVRRRKHTVCYCRVLPCDGWQRNAVPTGSNARARGRRPIRVHSESAGCGHVPHGCRRSGESSLSRRAMDATSYDWLPRRACGAFRTSRNEPTIWKIVSGISSTCAEMGLFTDLSTAI